MLYSARKKRKRLKAGPRTKSLPASEAPELPVPAAQEAPKVEDPAESMSLKGHLTELRSRLIKSAFSILVAFIGLFSFAPYIRDMLGKVLKAVLPPGGAITFVDITEAFMVDMHLAFVLSFFVASPFIFYQIWAFIAPGLYDSERKCVVPLALCSALFFIAGGAFCYGVVIPFTYPMFNMPQKRINYY